MRDMKYEMQLIAEEIAEDEYGKDFYDLAQDIQTKVYQRAQNAWTEQQIEAADFERDRIKNGD